MPMVKRSWRVSAYRSESVAEPLCCLVFLHQVGGRREKGGWRSQPIGAIPEAHPSRWVCWILDPQPLSFRSQKTILTIPATAKCDSFPEVFSPPSPRFFLLICIRASALPCAPFPPCVTLRDKAGNLLWCIEFNTPPSILCKLFYLLPHCCCF